MASSSNIILSNSTSSGSDETSHPENAMDIRKRKRMQSNRESARRSRQRKQKHLDDLTAQVSELKAQNYKILTTINATAKIYVDIEAENSVLRAQFGELSNRLQSLNEIIKCISHKKNYDGCEMGLKSGATSSGSCEFDGQEKFGRFDFEFDDGFSMNSWGFSFANYPIMPCLDGFMC